MKKPNGKVVVAVAFSAMQSIQASPSIAVRLSGSSSTVSQYLDYPGSYPVCKAGTTASSLGKWDDGSYPRADNHKNFFDTKNAFLEYGRYPTGTGYTNQTSYSGDDVKYRIAYYDNRAWNVTGVFLYREDWVYTDPGGSHPEDWRILSDEEIRLIRSAISNSTLRCKDTVELFQLLAGAGAAAGTAVGQFETWSPALKTHLLKFDGLGCETHVGDEINDPSVLANMAAIAKWTADNGKRCLVFVGGTRQTYVDLPAVQRTYQYLWKEMAKVGVDYRSDHIVYFRQGAYDGNHLPEDDRKTLSYQQAWLIRALSPGGTSLFIGDMPDRHIVADNAAVVPVTVGMAEVDSDRISIRATSSNPRLLDDRDLVFRGTGPERVLTIVPMPAQTGTATITLVASDGVGTEVTNSFGLSVGQVDSVTAASGGYINDPAIWGGAPVPVGRTDPLNRHVPSHPLSSSDNPTYIDLTATNATARVWKTGANAIDINGTPSDPDLQAFLTATNYQAFFGDTLEVSSGGQLAPGIANAQLTLNNLVLDGGTVLAYNTGGFRIYLRNGLTLNGGILKGGGSQEPRNVEFRNGYLAGSGTIHIAGSNSINGSQVRFHKSIFSTAGFTGLFKVATNGVLKLPDIPVDQASFGIELAGSGKFANDTDVAVTAFGIDGTALPPGTYAYGDLTPAQQSFLLSTNGTITVVSPPEPDFRIRMASGSLQIRAVNLPLPGTNVLQVKASLLDPAWGDLYSKVGAGATNWWISAEHPEQFYRVLNTPQ